MRTVTIRRLAWTFSTVLLGAMAPPARAADGPPGADVFFRHAQVRAASLAPSGEYIAMLMRGSGGRYCVYVAPTSDPLQGKVVASSNDVDIVRASWVNDRRIVFETGELTSEASDFNMVGSVFAVDRDGTAMLPLIAGDFFLLSDDGGTTVGSRVLPGSYQFESAAEDGSDDIIVYNVNLKQGLRELRVNQQWIEAKSVMPFRLNTRSRALTPLIDGRLPALPSGWVLDRNATPRLYTSESEGRQSIYYRDSATAPWRRIAEFETFADGSFKPEFFGYDGKLYVNQTNHDGFGGLHRFDLQNDRVEAGAVVEFAGFDYNAIAQSDHGARRILGFHYLTDAPGTVWLDASMKAAQAAVDKTLPGKINTITCGNCLASKTYLVVSHSDREPARFLLFDPSTAQLTALSSARRDIKPAQMGPRTVFRYATRDGLSIPVYVTMPPGKHAEPLPAVVMIHGGPWVRGASWVWSEEPQFLASRGYAVLEPEFRGATGYGFPLFKAGWQQWGLAMQDDIADATKWAIDKGIADPRRIAVGGASYGGYATLMALARNPELFRCGFEWVGVTDIRLMYDNSWNDTSEETVKYGLPRLIGDPEKDAARLRESSPVANAGRISQPLLMAYGAQDLRVPIKHGRELRAALGQANKNVEWIEYANEGHGWHLEEDNIDFWQHVEKFLDRNLRGL